LQYEAADFEWQIVSRLSELFRLSYEHLNLRLRRVDPRVDFAGEGLDPYCNLDNLICSARKLRQVYGEFDDQDPCQVADPIEDAVDPACCYGSKVRFTGITAGKSDIRARVYDKVSEADPGTLERWRKVWGDYEGETVWRWEYQLRGDFLKEFGANSMREFLGCLGDIFDYLLRWLRVAEVQARKDRDRSLVPWWAALVDSIKSLDLSRCGVSRSIIKRVANEEVLRRQLIGGFASWAARRALNSGATEFDYADHLNALIVAIDTELHKVEEKFAVKRQTLEAWSIT
jgi:hypothetical protein